MTDLPIGIIGGGISGMALALALQRQGKQCILFEKDKDFMSRHQGYGLTLQQGGKVLKKLGMLSILNEHCTLSNCHYIFDSMGTLVLGWGSKKDIVAQKSWTPKYNCHISRQNLRKCLLNELKTEFVTIYWSHQVETIIEYNDYVEIVFKDQSYKVKLVAGCDGIFSKIRRDYFPLLPSLVFLKMMVILGIYTPEHELFDERVCQFSDGITRLFCMPFDKSQYMWQLSFPYDEECKLTNIELSTLAIDQCKHFCDPVQTLLKNTCLDLISGYPVYDRDPLSDFTSSYKRMTLLGDAAHPMSPFKGQGANQAIVDALSLSDFLSKYPTTIAIQKYQEEMIKRTFNKVKLSRLAINDLHCPEFLDTFYQLNRRHYSNIDREMDKYKQLHDNLIDMNQPNEIDNLFAI